MNDLLAVDETPGVRDGSLIFERMHRVVVDIFNHWADEYDAFFEPYCGTLRDPMSTAKYVRHIRDLLRLAGVDLAGKSVLDVGCGFGLTLVLCGLLGANELHGIEINPGMIRTIDSYQDLLPSPIREGLRISAGDAACMPFEDEHFDVMLSIEAVSHYLEVDGFAAEAARVLKPNGVLVVSDGNNGLNPLTRRRNHRIWTAFECGPSDRCVEGYPVGTCYLERRKAFIDRHCPDLSQNDRALLARETFGMTLDQVAKACDCYVESGLSPGRTYRRCAMPVDPDGSVPERLIQPYRLAEALAHAGMESRVYGYWGGANGNPVLRSLNSCLMRLSPVTICSATAVRVVSVKKKATSRTPAARLSS